MVLIRRGRHLRAVRATPSSLDPFMVPEADRTPAQRGMPSFQLLSVEPSRATRVACAASAALAGLGPRFPALVEIHDRLVYRLDTRSQPQAEGVAC